MEGAEGHMPCVDIMENVEYIHGAQICEDDKNKIISAACAKDVSGGSVRFFSDSSQLLITYRISKRVYGNYPHIGITAQCGISVCYRIAEEKDWYNLNCYYGKQEEHIVQISMNRLVDGKSRYEMIIYLPILAFVSELKIEYKENSIFYAADKKEKKVLNLGGVLSFGAGVTSTQFLFANIMARRENIEIINVAFYDWRWFDHAVKILHAIDEELKQSDILMIEIPVIHYPTDLLEKQLKSVLEYIHTTNGEDSRVIIWSSPCFYDKREKDIERHEILKEIIVTYQGTFKELILDDMFSVWNKREWDQYAYSRNFVNDYGNVFIYERLTNLIGKGDGIS